jgi:hypothetical protein
LDFGGVLRGPLPDQRYVIVAGLKVKEGQKIEQAIRDVVKELGPKERENIKLDHQRVLGTTVHLIRPPEREVDENAKKIFGNMDIFLAIREDVAFVTVGQQGLAAMKEAIDGAGKAAGKGGAPVQFEVSVSKVVPLSPENQEKMAEAVKKVFTGADQNRDKVRITLQGGEALRLRIEADAAIIKLVAALSPLGGG